VAVKKVKHGELHPLPPPKKNPKRKGGLLHSPQSFPVFNLPISLTLLTKKKEQFTGKKKEV